MQLSEKPAPLELPPRAGSAKLPDGRSSQTAIARGHVTESPAPTSHADWRKTVASIFLWLMAGQTVASLLWRQHYLPSEAWRAIAWHLAPAYTVLVHVITIWLLFRGHKAACAVAPPENQPAPPGIFIVIFGPFLFSLSALLMVYVMAPAFVALLIGEPVRHAFTVEEAQAQGNKWCRQPVSFKDMPFAMIGDIKLCDVPSNIRARLIPGQTVILSGQGTWMGLYVEDFELRPSP